MEDDSGSVALDSKQILEEGETALSDSEDEGEDILPQGYSDDEDEDEDEMPTEADLKFIAQENEESENGIQY